MVLDAAGAVLYAQHCSILEKIWTASRSLEAELAAGRSISGIAKDSASRNMRRDGERRMVEGLEWGVLAVQYNTM